MKVRIRNRTNGVSPMITGTNAQVDIDRLPFDAFTGQPLPPRAQPGYYPGFSTLSQQAYWDEATRNVVKARVEQVPPIRFFSAEQARLMQTVCDRLLPQDDRDEAHKIPIVNYIDDRLYNRRIDGYRFEDMPEDHEAHLLGLKAIDAIAQHMFSKSFIQIGPREQDQVLQTIHDGNPPAGEDIWQRMPVSRFWMLLMQDAVDAYYAHPYAWDEIGFGGPAYPRGYMRLEGGKPEPPGRLRNNAMNGKRHLLHSPMCTGRLADLGAISSKLPGKKEYIENL